MALGTLYNLEIHRGDDRQITGTVVDENDDAVNITGATLTYVITDQDPSANYAQPKKGATALVTKTVGSGIVLTDAVNGDIRIDLGSGDTVTFTAPKTYYHEIQIVLSSLTTTIMYGNIVLARDIIAPGP